ncbi:MAG: RsmG family class I SAM-dependent methyltransferase [Polyangiales bacterium]
MRGSQGHESVVDIGAGVGAPTLPWLLDLPATHARLVEPRRKRVAFLRQAIGVLNLSDRVDILEARLEEKAPKRVGEFEVALSRAPFAPQKWLELGSSSHRRLLFLVLPSDPNSRTCVSSKRFATRFLGTVPIAKSRFTSGATG